MNNELLEKLLTSKKYKYVCPDTVKRILSECEGKYKKPKDIEKAAREKLHGITSAFMTDAEYKRALNLCEAEKTDENLTQLLSCHASTRERLPLSAMDELYGRIFSVTGIPETLLDLACGMNPVYIAYRYPDMRIHCEDISGQSINVIQNFSETAEAAMGDLLSGVPEEKYDVALLFKVLPLLDRQESGAADRVLNAVQAKYIVCSFPTRTLGGRNVGMEDNYSAWMEAHIPEKYAVCARFTTENELYYILKES